MRRRTYFSIGRLHIPPFDPAQCSCNHRDMPTHLRKHVEFSVNLISIHYTFNWWNIVGIANWMKKKLVHALCNLIWTVPLFRRAFAQIIANDAKLILFIWTNHTLHGRSDNLFFYLSTVPAGVALGSWRVLFELYVHVLWISDPLIFKSIGMIELICYCICRIRH